MSEQNINVYDPEIDAICKFTTQFQVDGYKTYSKHRTYNRMYKLILRIASEISVITGAISVLLGVFV